MKEIEESRQPRLSRFIFALGIPNVGSHVADLMAREFESLDDLMGASRERLEEIGEVGPEIAESIDLFFSQSENRDMVEELMSLGLDLRNPACGNKEGGSLNGLSFVFTGSLEQWTRDEVKRLVEERGASTASSVSGNTDYVVAGSDPGSKKEEAEDRGIPILDEEGFQDLLEEKS